MLINSCPGPSFEDCRKPVRCTSVCLTRSGLPSSAYPKIRPKLEMTDITVTPVEEKLFPEIVRAIFHLKDEWKSKRDEFDKLAEEIDQVENRRHDLQEVTAEKIEQLQTQLEGCQQELVCIQERFHDLSRSIHQELLIAEVALRDGFELAPWYFDLPPNYATEKDTAPREKAGQRG